MWSFGDFQRYQYFYLISLSSPIEDALCDYITCTCSNHGLFTGKVEYFFETTNISHRLHSTSNKYEMHQVTTNLVLYI